MMMSSSLVPSYPTGDHLEGNFITDYVNGYTYFDRNVARKYGERGIEVDYDTTIAEASADWLQDVNSIVFQHLNDWAKMYSALIKDYEPLWNVDGTVVTTYGETENNDQYGATQKTTQYGATQDTMQHGAKTVTDTFGATQDTMQYGATQDTTQYGATSVTTEYGATSATQGGGTDTHNHYERSYPDGTNIKTQYDEDIIASRTNTTTQHSDTVNGTLHSDVESSIQHSDVASSTQHIDTHGTAQYSDVASSIQHSDIESALLHSDKHTSEEHVDTERRTGNIGVTKSTELVESEEKLRIKYNFFDIIFKFMMKEMGAIYYDWY